MSHRKLIISAGILVFGGLFAWGALGFILVCCDPLHERAGQFGDFFGPLNVLFSSVAAGGAVYAVYLQTMELKEARKDRDDEVRFRKVEEAMTLHELALRKLEERRKALESEVPSFSDFYKEMGDVLGSLEKFRGPENPLIESYAEQTIKDRLKIRKHMEEISQRIQVIESISSQIEYDRLKKWMERNPELEQPMKDVFSPLPPIPI